MLLESIHSRVGLILQTKSERSGKASAFMTAETFKRFLTNFLSSENDFKGEKLEQRVNELYEIALHRLVLLSCQRDDEISFDVRSLQEFMAAKELVGGHPDFIERRLLHISDKAHWEHTFLIAANKYFATTDMVFFRSIVVALPRDLELVPEHKIIANGAYLAKKMFADGIALDSDGHRRKLAQHALEYMKVSPKSALSGFESLNEKDTNDIFRETIRDYMNNPETPEGLVAWASAILAIEDMNVDSRDRCLEKFKTLNQQTKVNILTYGSVGTSTKTSCDLILELSRTLSPQEVRDHFGVISRTVATELKENLKAPPVKLKNLYYLTLFSGAFKDRKSIDLFPETEKFGDINFLLQPIGGSAFDLSQVDSQLQENWPELSLINDFYSDPTDEKLIGILKQIHNQNDIDRLRAFYHILPWPVYQILQSTSNAAEIADIVTDYPKGDFGNVEKYKKAEIRWSEKGVSKDDVEYSLNVESVLQSNIASRGMPPFLWRISQSSDLHNAYFEIWKLISTKLENKLAHEFFNMLSVGFSDSAHETSISIKQSRELLKMMAYVSVNTRNPRQRFLNSMFLLSDKIWTDDSCVDDITKIVKSSTGSVGYRHIHPGAVKLLKYYKRSQVKKELLFLIAVFGDFTQVSDTDLEIIKKAEISFKKTDSKMVTISKIVFRTLKSSGQSNDFSAIASAVKQVDDISGVERVIRRVINCRFPDNAKDNGTLQKRLKLVAMLIKDARTDKLGEIPPYAGLLRLTFDKMTSSFSDRDEWIDKFGLPEDSYEFVANDEI